MTEQAAKADAPDPEAEKPEAEEQTPPAPSFKPVRDSWLQWKLASVTAISFSLTFVGVSVALLAGVLPPALASLEMPIDLGVFLLLVPLCALVLAIVAEAFRAAIRGVPNTRARRTVTALSDWRPGHGEG